MQLELRSHWISVTNSNAMCRMVGGQRRIVNGTRRDTRRQAMSAFLDITLPFRICWIGASWYPPGRWQDRSPPPAGQVLLMTAENGRNAMAFVAAPNCVEMAIIWTLDLIPCETTFHYRLPAPASLANLAAAPAVVFGWFGAHQASFTSELSLTKCYLRALDSSSAPTFEVNPTLPLAGTNTNGVAPNNVSFALTRYTGKAGRKMRGRVYQPGIPDTWLETPNSLFADDAQAVATIWDDLRTRMLAATPVYTEVILHKVDGTHDDVIGYRYSDLFVDSQRRRLPGHNIHH